MPVFLSILAVAAMAGLAIWLYMRNNKMKTLEKDRMFAAARLLKEDSLIHSLTYTDQNVLLGVRTLIELSWKEEKVERYVFDPAKKVRIGRSPQANDISVSWDTISANHCEIFQTGTQLCLQDCGSANGTFIKRGRKIYQVKTNAVLAEGDTIIVGGLRMNLHIFNFDTAWI